MNNLPKFVTVIKAFDAGYKTYNVGDRLPVSRAHDSRLILVNLTDTSIMTLNEMMTLGYIEKTALYRNN